MALEGGQNRFINRDFSPNETTAVFYVLRWLYVLRETTLLYLVSLDLISNDQGNFQGKKKLIDHGRLLDTSEYSSYSITKRMVRR